MSTPARSVSSLPPRRARSAWRTTFKIIVSLIVSCPGTWGSFALWYQLPGGYFFKVVGSGLWIVFSCAVLVAIWHGRVAVGLLTFCVAFALLLVWWRLLPATNARLWSDDVAQMTSGVVSGNYVTLHNVRNFEWRSNDDFTPRWETREYDLTELHSVDLIMSYWSGPAIAHMLVSFGFARERYVAFSVEVRREKNQSFSEIGGFFKQFELSIIAADERDVVRVRTNVRGEDDYLYRVHMSPDAMRSLFLAYIEEANQLVETPRFYNTVTTNCTTLVYHMMNRIVGHLPLSFRLLLTGYLPGYIYSLGGLDSEFTLKQLRSVGHITQRAKDADKAPTFSTDIRRGIPEIR